MILANAPAEVIAAARCNLSGADSQDCEVWEENWRALLLFITVQTQWCIAPMGGYIGLNYVAVESVMNMTSIEATERPALFDDLRLIEQTALSILNKK